MLRIGLTGGIASGKSVVARRLALAGLPTLDLDRVAHELMAPGQPAHREVVAAFGEGILGPGGAIDRAALGAIVFADPLARARLNALVHPRVREAEAAHADALERRGAVFFVTEAALLVESGLHLRFDRLVVVHCPPGAQMQRLQERGLGEAAARARLESQMPMEAKRRFAHFTVDTAGTLEDTHREADALARRLPELSRSEHPRIRLPRDRALGGLVHGASEGPRGLGPALLADHLAKGPLDLPALARQLVPPVEGPWYEAAEGAPLPDGAPGAAEFMVPVVLHEVDRHGRDDERVAAAAHSLSCLVERGGARRGAAILFALAVAEVAAQARVPPDLDRRALTLFEQSGRHFAGHAPPASVVAALRAAGAAPGSPEEARRAAAASGAPPALAGALVGLATGSRASPEGPYARFLDALAGPAPG